MNELIIKGEFINFLRKNLKKRSDDEKINDNEIHKLVYGFIFEKVVGKGVKEIKVKKKPIADFYIGVVDFCLSFGEVIINVISDLKRYGDLEKYEIKEKIIDV